MAKRFTAFISDLDGTLVDSEPQHGEAWLATLSSHGFHYDHDWFEQYIGTSDRRLAEDVIATHQLSLGVRDLQLDKQHRYHEIVRQHGRLFPGVAAALREIASRYPFAIATNSGRADAEVVFDATGLRPYATHSVTADDVTKLKPAPEMYLLAAGKLGVPPENCVVCEDSVAGATGAKAAGCYVIGIGSGDAAAKLTMVDEVIAESQVALTRVLELLEQED